MAKDFLKYQHIIDDFRGQVLKADFEAKFNSATKKIPKTERFLLKMELKRLAGQCTRLVDLRGHVDGDCKAYEHEERIHYLDDNAIKVFQDAITHYGSYTFGVYEAVMNTENNFRVMYQKEKMGIAPTAKSSVNKVFEKTQYYAQQYKYGPYYNRSEERMNFAVSVSVHVNKHRTLEATSSDLSTKGCKLRFNETHDFEIGQAVELNFTGLAEEFQFGKQNLFVYEVRNIQNSEGMQLIGFERVFPTEERRDGFRQFLSGYIQGNKRRYKINLDNTIEAIQARTFEQFTIPKSNELPVFLTDESGVALPRYALTCANNQSIFQHWQDEGKHSTLDFLLTQDRLQRLQKAKRLGKSLLVYSFIHESKGRHYFYTADNIQLEEDSAFLAQFISFAANKPSFSLCQLNLLAFDASTAYSPLTLANTLAKKDEYLNLPLTKEAEGLIARISHLVTVAEVDDKRIVEEYRQVKVKEIDTAKLRKYGHKRRSTPLTVDHIGINYRNQRGEPRFIYKTPVSISIQNVEWTGSSCDFSASGLKIELDKPVILKKGEVVNVTFPELQKITSAFDLKALPYEVMRVNKKKTIVNLRVFVEKHQHIGRSFFRALIDKNKSKLTADEYELQVPGLAKALRNIYSHSVTLPSLIVQTSGSRYKIEAVTSHDDKSRLLGYCRQLSDRNKLLNLYPVLSNLQATNLLSTSLKQMKPSDASITDVLYIAINPESELVEQAVQTKLASELKSDKIRSMFIKRALKRGELICLQVKLSRTDEPDMQHLNPELSYVGSYAIHRGKQLEQDIWSVAGVLQIFDITSELMIRQKLEQYKVADARVV